MEHKVTFRRSARLLVLFIVIFTVLTMGAYLVTYPTDLVV